MSQPPVCQSNINAAATAVSQTTILQAAAVTTTITKRQRAPEATVLMKQSLCRRHNTARASAPG